ncbi:MAG: PD-(D/E)XK nuclease family protein [Treponema sp.]|jgi:hypothetical protein|nr:PD-(D/E)XK nuclease family protein [Treponema sp.]
MAAHNGGLNSVEALLLKNADDPEALFVFPTDVAASGWADHLLRIRGGGTAAMEKFIAWDTFKRNSIRSRVQDKKSVPSVMRKIFASCLIRENMELCGAGGTPLFTSLIVKEYAQQAAGFADWLAGILPQLGLWLREAAGISAAGVGKERPAKILDGTDRDLYTLALRYGEFLDGHGLFEPAWETPPFDDTGKKCFIFFPEALADYSEYRDLLEKTERVIPVRLSETGAADKPRHIFFYTNSRSEISEAALYIRALHEEKKIPWDTIAVSLPDTENYEPYVLREFACRNIPFVRRTGKPLASYPAGQFFRALAGCVSRDFAFDALVALLSNRHLPWKDSEDIQRLIDFGIKNNCIASWFEEEDGGQLAVNVWEEAFRNPFGGYENSTLRFYRDMKSKAGSLRGANSFAELRRQYFNFRERFFDMDACLPETDLILSRCVSELMSLAEIEKAFPDVKAPDPFMFFTEHLQDISYLARQPSSGVAILPYRTAAPAPFTCHVILGASQNNLSTVFSRLGFLSRIKREQLGIADEDVSEAYINLHKLNSAMPAVFFCAEQGFSGYAIPHSRLGAPAEPRLRYAKDNPAGAREGPPAAEASAFAGDLFRAESGFYRALQRGGAGETAFPSRLHESQAAGFEAWRGRRTPPAPRAENNAKPGGGTLPGKFRANPALLRLIRDRFCGGSAFPGKFSVSATSLGAYYTCALKWLFERVLCLETVEIEAGLGPENMAGTIYHAVLNRFFTELKNSETLLPVPAFSAGSAGEGSSPESGTLPPAYRALLEASTREVFDAFPRLTPGKSAEMSALAARLTQAEEKSVLRRLEKCLAALFPYLAGFRVTGSEAKYTAERDAYYLNGTVDLMLEDAREDSDSGGAAFIVDFKLKNMPKRAECTGKTEKGLTNFQLPMYLSLAEENGAGEVQGAFFFSILDAGPRVLFGAVKNQVTKRTSPGRKKDIILRTDDLFADIMNEFKTKTGQYVSEIGDGNFSTLNSDYNTCAACSCHRICRTTYKIDRETGLQDREDEGT